jgi:hypothetical protein
MRFLVVESNERGKLMRAAQGWWSPEVYAISTYLLIAIAKKRLHLDHHSLYEILQILSLSMFETIPINQLLTPPSINSDPDFEPNQLALL